MSGDFQKKKINKQLEPVSFFMVHFFARKAKKKKTAFLDYCYLYESVFLW